MDLLVPLGIIFFFTGLVLSHIVLGMTRGLAKKKQKLKKIHTILMWSSVGLVIIGLGLGAIGYFFG